MRGARWGVGVLLQMAKLAAGRTLQGSSGQLARLPAPQVWVPVVEVVNSTAADGSKKRVTHWRQAVVQVRAGRPVG